MDASKSEVQVSGSSNASTRRSLCHDKCQKEARWFSEPYPVPDPSLSNDDTEHMEAFQKLIWDHEPGKILPQYGVAPEDLARLCGEGEDGHLLLPQVLWILNKLNNDPGRGPRRVMCFAMATVGPQLLSCLHTMKTQGVLTPVRYLLVLLTVKRADDGAVSMVPSSQSDSHWTVAVASLSEGRMVYCDSLGWKPPEDLVPRTAAVIQVFEGQPNTWSIVVAHRPTPFPGHHQCGDKCLNYPLQLCASMSGVVAVIFTARFVLKDGAFQDLVNTVSQHGTFFDQPNCFSRYLRRKVITWFVTGVIDVSFLARPSSVQMVDSRQLRTQCPNTPSPHSAKPSTPNSVKPSILHSAKPSTPKSAKPSTPKRAKPSTPKSVKPSTPKSAKPSTPKSAKPSTPKSVKPSISNIAKPSTPNSVKPSISNSETNSSPIAPPPLKKVMYAPKLLKLTLEDHTATTNLKHKQKASDVDKSSSTDDTKEKDRAVSILSIPGAADQTGIEDKRDMSTGTHDRQGASSKTTANTGVQQERSKTTANTGVQQERSKTTANTAVQQERSKTTANTGVQQERSKTTANTAVQQERSKTTANTAVQQERSKTTANTAVQQERSTSMQIPGSEDTTHTGTKDKPKKPKKKKKQEPPQTCPYCSARLGNRWSLTRHVGKQHPTVDRSLFLSNLSRPVHVPCQLCETKTWCMRQLIVHYKEVHGKGVSIQTASFADKQQFEKWKKELEENTRTKFCQRFGSKKRSSHTVTYYFCHRTGHKWSQETGKKRQRKRSTYKISGQCTAFLTMACAQDGPVWVEYCVDHVGHDLDLKYLRVTKHRVREIQRLSQGPEGEKYKKRLEEMRNSAFYDDREIQVTEKDASTAPVQRSVSDGEKAEPGEASSDLCEDMPSEDSGTTDHSSRHGEDLQQYKENVKTKLSVVRDLVEEMEDLETLKDVLQHLDTVVTACRRSEADPVGEEVTQQASSSKTCDAPESRLSAEGKADPKTSSTVHDSVLEDLRRNEQRVAVESLTEMLTLDWNETLTSVW